MLESLTGDNSSKILALAEMPRGPCDSSFPIQGCTKTQFSLRVGFARTINKARGYLISGAIGLELIDTVFSLGLLHAGLSRVAYPSKLKEYPPPNLNSQAKNVVYPGALT